VTPSQGQVIAVFGASRPQPGDPEYLAGIECGSRLAAAGFTVATGGYGGIMEAACRGAREAGGSTIGVTAPSVFPGRAGANPWVQEELAADDLVQRIGILTSIAAGYVAMPGSLGTLAELLIAWNLAFVAPFSETSCGPIVAVGDTWSRLVPELTAQLKTDGDHVAIVASVEEAVSYLAKTLR
jgi:uncharacterized protein (TIGR00730 family)